eukprot:TRINITY_DN2840_c0_g1_i1.p1 TRINITY_DN2840_c0_g1~~TRINITY_DN2840_c0_g1_i1.p1  ORF type:complete len:1263 (+),score=367.34 TRINITY_DN2840_c0_g1_i1:270-4058(+)
MAAMVLKVVVPEFPGYSGYYKPLEEGVWGVAGLRLACVRGHWLIADERSMAQGIGVVRSLDGADGVPPWRVGVWAARSPETKAWLPSAGVVVKRARRKGDAGACEACGSPAAPTGRGEPGALLAEGLRPRWWVVAGAEGAILRQTDALASREVVKLAHGTHFAPLELRGRRVRVGLPVGWVPAAALRRHAPRPHSTVPVCTVGPAGAVATPYVEPVPPGPSAPRPVPLAAGEEVVPLGERGGQVQVASSVGWGSACGPSGEAILVPQQAWCDRPHVTPYGWVDVEGYDRGAGAVVQALSGVPVYSAPSCTPGTEVDTLPSGYAVHVFDGGPGAGAWLVAPAVDWDAACRGYSPQHSPPPPAAHTPFESPTARGAPPRAALPLPPAGPPRKAAPAKHALEPGSLPWPGGPPSAAAAAAAPAVEAGVYNVTVSVPVRVRVDVAEPQPAGGLGGLYGSAALLPSESFTSTKDVRFVEPEDMELDVMAADAGDTHAGEGALVGDPAAAAAPKQPGDGASCPQRSALKAKNRQSSLPVVLPLDIPERPSPKRAQSYSRPATLEHTPLSGEGECGVTMSGASGSPREDLLLRSVPRATSEGGDTSPVASVQDNRSPRDAVLMESSTRQLPPSAASPLRDMRDFTLSTVSSKSPRHSPELLPKRRLRVDDAAEAPCAETHSSLRAPSPAHHRGRMQSSLLGSERNTSGQYLLASPTGLGGSSTSLASASQHLKVSFADKANAGANGAAAPAVAANTLPVYPGRPNNSAFSSSVSSLSRPAASPADAVATQSPAGSVYFINSPAPQANDDPDTSYLPASGQNSPQMSPQAPAGDPGDAARSDPASMGGSPRARLAMPAKPPRHARTHSQDDAAAALAVDGSSFATGLGVRTVASVFLSDQHGGKRSSITPLDESAPVPPALRLREDTGASLLAPPAVSAPGSSFDMSSPMHLPHAHHPLVIPPASPSSELSASTGHTQTPHPADPTPTSAGSPERLVLSPPKAPAPEQPPDEPPLTPGLSQNITLGSSLSTEPAFAMAVDSPGFGSTVRSNADLGEMLPGPLADPRGPTTRNSSGWTRTGKPAAAEPQLRLVGAWHVTTAACDKHPGGSYTLHITSQSAQGSLHGHTVREWSQEHLPVTGSCDPKLGTILVSIEWMPKKVSSLTLTAGAGAAVSDVGAVSLKGTYTNHYDATGGDVSVVCIPVSPKETPFGSQIDEGGRVPPMQLSSGGGAPAAADQSAANPILSVSSPPEPPAHNFPAAGKPPRMLLAR